MLLVKLRLLRVPLQVLFTLQKTLAALNLMMNRISVLFLNRKGTPQRAQILLQRQLPIAMGRMLFRIKRQ